MKKIHADSQWLLHKNIAYIAILLIAMGVMYLAPEHLSRTESNVFFVISQVAFYLGLFENKRFNGYGVRERVNAMAKLAIVPDFGPLVWHGFVPKPLARSWKLSLMLNTALLAVAVWYVLSPRDPDMMSAVSGVIISYVCAKLLALAGEMYVWLMADRHRHWYLYEGKLKKALDDQHRSPQAIVQIVQRARNEHLLLTLD